MTDEEIRTFFDENYLNSTYLVVPKFDPETYNNLDETALAAAKAEAEGYYNRAVSGEDFNAILADWEKKNYTEDQMAAHDHEAEGAHDMVVPKTSTQVPPEFLTQVGAAEIGKPIFFEDDFYYYVAIRKDLTGTVADSTLASARTSILLELRSQEYLALCDEWVAALSIEENAEALKRYTPEKLNMEALLGDSSSNSGGLSLSAVPEDEASAESSESAAESSESAAESSEAPAESSESAAESSQPAESSEPAAESSTAA